MEDRLLEAWRKRLDAAAARYAGAKAAALKAISEHMDPNSTTGHEAVARALRLESAAFSEFNQLQGAFKRALLYREGLPDEQ